MYSNVVAAHYVQHTPQQRQTTPATALSICVWYSCRRSSHPRGSSARQCTLSRQPPPNWTMTTSRPRWAAWCRVLANSVQMCCTQLCCVVGNSLHPVLPALDPAVRSLPAGGTWRADRGATRDTVSRGAGRVPAPAHHTQQPGRLARCGGAGGVRQSAQICGHRYVNAHGRNWSCCLMSCHAAMHSMRAAQPDAMPTALTCACVCAGLPAITHVLQSTSALVSPRGRRCCHCQLQTRSSWTRTPRTRAAYTSWRRQWSFGLSRSRGCSNQTRMLCCG